MKTTTSCILLALLLALSGCATHVGNPNNEDTGTSGDVGLDTGTGDTSVDVASDSGTNQDAATDTGQGDTTPADAGEDTSADAIGDVAMDVADTDAGDAGDIDVGDATDVGDADVMHDTDASDVMDDTDAQPVELCDNGIDDDGDEQIDCFDADCDADMACVPAAAEVCDDEMDNDGDGATDCDDGDCVTFAGCEEGTVGTTDVCYFACLVDPNPAECRLACLNASETGGDAETACEDGLDNDGDEAIDCDDADCTFDAGCGD